LRAGVLLNSQLNTQLNHQNFKIKRTMMTGDWKKSSTMPDITVKAFTIAQKIHYKERSQQLLCFTDVLSDENTTHLSKK
jgi:hypothetical protein